MIETNVGIVGSCCYEEGKTDEGRALARAPGARRRRLSAYRLVEGLRLGDDVLLEVGRVVAVGRALGDVRHLVDAHHQILGGVHLLEVLERRDGRVQAVAVQPVQQRVLQQRRRLVLALHVVAGAVDV
eukprot:9060109-Pyramimonas_sp.AAC.1